MCCHEEVKMKFRLVCRLNGTIPFHREIYFRETTRQPRLLTTYLIEGFGRLIRLILYIKQKSILMLTIPFHREIYFRETTRQPRLLTTYLIEGFGRLIRLILYIKQKSILMLFFLSDTLTISSIIL